MSSLQNLPLRPASINLTKTALSAAATLSLSRLQTAPSEVSDTVHYALWKPTEPFEKGETLNEFSVNLKCPLPTKSKCGMNM